MTTHARSDELPSVSVVIVNFNGNAHLEKCLPSLYDLNYPSHLLEIVVVDNSSTDGSQEWLKEHYPDVRLEQIGSNIGFAPAVNVGARLSTGAVIALLNNDMVVDADWLGCLVEKIDLGQGIAAAGALILDWNGERVDFHDAAMTFYGLGLQPGHGLDQSLRRTDDGADLLFACGGAMAIDRATFLDVGGFDDDYFAYYEDVDLGWRLRVLGYRTVLAAGAICRHRHHGSSGSVPSFQRSALLERNALRTIIKNYDDESLRRLLGPSLLLLISRALLASGSDPDDYRFFLGAEDATEDVSRLGMAPLHAVGAVMGELPQLFAKRRAIQSRRRTPDHEITPLFQQPLRAVMTSVEATEQDHLWLGTQIDELAKALELDRYLGGQPVRRLVVLAYGEIGKKMAGPAIRSWEIAKALAGTTQVTVASETLIERTAPGVEISRYRTSAELQAIVASADAVLMFGHQIRRHPWLKQVDALRIIDLYDPWTFEQIEQVAHGPLIPELETPIHVEVDTQNELIDVGDYFICASERQRDYWLGMLTSRGRVGRMQYAADPDLRALIDVVPYGCPATPPTARNFRELHPEVPDDAFIVLWSGGVWDWFDPLMVIDAVSLARERDPRIHLCFMGLELNGDGVPTMRNTAAVWARIKELGLDAGEVILGPWVPYDERGAYLTASDVAVIATKPVAEVRFSFRSRVLDHYWAGLPTITTGGDVISDQIVEAGAGYQVPIGNAGALADLLVELAADRSEAGSLATAGHAARSLAREHRWDSNVDPLRSMLRTAWKWRELRAFRPHRLAVSEEQIRRERRGAGGDGRSPRRIRQDRRHAWMGRLKSGRLGSSPFFPMLRSVRRTRLGVRIFGKPTSA